MGELRDNWAKSFAGTDRELWVLEEAADCDLKLYEAKDKISADESSWWEHREPTFHVWKGDDWLYCGNDYQAALAKYRKTKEEAMQDE